MLNIINVYQTAPFEEGQGGGVRYVKNLLTGIKNYCDELLFLGVGKQPSKQEHIEFIPITKNSTNYIYFLFLLMLKLPFLDLSKFDLVHVHRLYFAIPFILLKPSLKIVCSLHGRTFTVFESKHGSFQLKIMKPLFMMIESFALKHIDYLVPVSQDVLHSFENKYPELMQSKKDTMEILSSMMNLDHFTIQDSDFLQKKYGERNQYILFIGRLADVKDIPFLIGMFSEAFQNLPKIKLVIAGDGEKKHELQTLAQKQCNQNAPIFMGEIPSETMPKLISSARVVVLCSKHEASPTVVKEALSCGVPIVSNKVGDVDEFIENGENGMIVDKTFDAYAIAIKTFLGENIKKDIIRTNSKDVLEKCTIQFIAKRYMEIYKKVIDR